MANNFIFQTTRNILSELGGIAKLGRLVGPNTSNGMGCSRVLVVTDPGVRAAGLVDPALRSLADTGVEYAVFDAVVADPPEQVVHDACAAARDLGAEGVVGLGGGSSMDVAKLVAFLESAGTSQALTDIYGVGACVGERLPLVQIPTTAGTGSEVTPISIVTTGENAKMGVVSPQLLPDWALLDGELTLSVPPAVTAATGIDAMVHAIEAYTSCPRKNPLSDALAREALALLAGNIRRSWSHGADGDARSAMLLGSTYAGMAFANAPVAAVHALAYPVGSHFHVPHGLSNSLMLPHVLRFNAADGSAAQQYAELMPLIFPERAAAAASSSTEAAVHELADGLADLAVELEIPTTLQDVEIAASDVELLATEAMKQTRLLPNNPREVTLDDARALYSAAMG